MCGRPLITRQDFLRAALTLAAAPLLRSLPARADDTAETTEIAPGIFVHQGRYELQSPENRGDMANASFIVGSECVAVIDTLGSAVAGRELVNTIRAVTNKPIRYVINTHMHPDHVFGNAAFKEDAPTFVGHHKLARGLATRAERYLAINKEMLGAQAARWSSSPSAPLIPTTTSPSPTARPIRCLWAISSSRCMYRRSTARSKAGSR
jgi:glyoxylase-like metal-dependent hydrolase (beta-lactamase superfamily II)